MIARRIRIQRLLRHPVTQNAIGLYAVQAASILLPVVLVPYLARVLRPSGWGAIVIAQSFAIWLQLIIDYGFNYSASREIAGARDDSQHTAQIASGVIGAKIGLTIVAVAIAIAAQVWIPVFRLYPSYVWWALLLAISQSLYPIWYFQGIENLRGPAFINIMVRLAGAGLTILVVNSPDDAWKVLAVQVTSAAVTAFITMLWMYRRIRFVHLSLNSAWKALGMGRSMFLFSGASSLYNSANSFILGLFVPTQQVGYYGGAERIHRFGISPFGPISQALYPFMVRSVHSDYAKAKRNIRRILLGMFILGLLVAVTIVSGAPLLVMLFLGSEYEASIPLLQLFAIQIPISALSRTLGILWLLPLRMDFIFNSIVISGAITNLTLAFILVPLLGSTGMVVSFVFSELIVTCGMIVATQHRDGLLWPWRQEADTSVPSREA